MYDYKNFIPARFHTICAMGLKTLSFLDDFLEIIRVGQDQELARDFVLYILDKLKLKVNFTKGILEPT